MMWVSLPLYVRFLAGVKLYINIYHGKCSILASLETLSTYNAVFIRIHYFILNWQHTVRSFYFYDIYTFRDMAQQLRFL